MHVRCDVSWCLSSTLHTNASRHYDGAVANDGVRLAAAAAGVVVAVATTGIVIVNVCASQL